MSDSSSDKTEKATPERRRQAREKGDFPKARDAGGVGAALAVLLALVAGGTSAGTKLRAFAQHCFSEPFDLGRSEIRARWSSELSRCSASWRCPAPSRHRSRRSPLASRRPAFSRAWSSSPPNPSRLNPMGKIKSLFTPNQAMVELVQSILRVGVIGYVVYDILKGSLPLILHLARADMLGAVGAIARALAELVVKATAALTVLTACDYLYTKYKWEKQNMMSRQEVKDESRQMEGDPRVKAQQRARARQRMRKGLAKQVRSADVIVANPTHISVALRYRAKEGAPDADGQGLRRRRASHPRARQSGQHSHHREPPAGPSHRRQGESGETDSGRSVRRRRRSAGLRLPAARAQDVRLGAP